MGRFTDNQPLPAMPKNGMQGLVALDNNGDNPAYVQSQQWGDRQKSQSIPTREGGYDDESDEGMEYPGEQDDY